jgi:phosphotransferase family enzyme
MTVLELIVVDDPGQLVDDIADVTPAWIGAVLRARTGADVRVRGVRSSPVGTGQTGVSYRVELDHEGQRDGVPDSLVVKLAAGTDDQRAMVAPGYAWEVGFYQHLAQRVRVRTPRCWHGAISPDHRRFTLVLEDLAPAVAGRQADGCDLAQARRALRNLAGLHAPLWNDPLLQGGLEWLQPPDPDFIAMLTAVSADATGKFLDRFADRLPTEDTEVLHRAAELTEHWTLAHQKPFAVIHGDYRLDNLMFHPDGEVAALDWQTTMVAHPLRDVAYFLSLSLPPPVRREHEEELVAEYHGALLDLGVTDYSLDECHEGYRTGMLQGPLITVLGCVYSTATRTREADDMFLSMVARSGRAIRELGTLEAVAR